MNTWPTKSMAQVTRLVTDGKHGDCEDEEGSGYFFLSSKDLRDGRLHYDRPRQITQSGFIETHRRTNLEPGDILLANCGASIGRVGFAQDDPRIHKTTFQKSISVIKADENLVDRRFLYYFFCQKSDLLIRLGNGAAQPNLLIGDLKRIEVPLPPIPIQRRISETLCAYDELIENNQQRVKILRAMSSYLFREWFVHFRFPGHENQPHVASPLGDIPVGWETRKVTDFADFVRGVEPGSKAYSTKQLPGFVPFLRVGDLSKRDGGLFIPNELSGGKLITPTDIAITLDGSIGLVRIGLSGAYSTGIRKVLIQNKMKLGWSFIYHLLRSDQIQATINAHAKGATIKHAGTAVGAMTFVSPSDQILSQFESLSAPMLMQVLALNDQIENLRRTRDLLLPRLLSGQINMDLVP